jgi:hypothetical protein
MASGRKLVSPQKESHGGQPVKYMINNQFKFKITLVIK